MYSTCIYFYLLSHVQVLKQFTPFEHLYTQDREKVIAEFQSANNHLSDVEGEIEYYEHIEDQIQLLPNILTVSQTVLLSTGENMYMYMYITVHACTCTCTVQCDFRNAFL